MDPSTSTAKSLQLPAGQLVSIPGGSIFCHCLVGEFVRVLGEVAVVDPRPEGVIVEASGIADPKVVVVGMLAETKLDAMFDLRRVVTVVDPGSFHKLIQTLPAITAQVEASDLVLINKTDLYDAGEVGLNRGENSDRSIPTYEFSGHSMAAWRSICSVSIRSTKTGRSVSGVLEYSVSIRSGEIPTTLPERSH